MGIFLVRASRAAAFQARLSRGCPLAMYLPKKIQWKPCRKARLQVVPRPARGGWIRKMFLQKTQRTRCRKPPSQAVTCLQSGLAQACDQHSIHFGSPGMSSIPMSSQVPPLFRMLRCPHAAISSRHSMRRPAWTCRIFRNWRARASCSRFPGMTRARSHPLGARSIRLEIALHAFSGSAAFVPRA